jgi:ribosomal protein S11
MVMEPGANLTLNGQGSLAVTFGLDYAFPASGQIVINDRASLVNAGAIFDIRPSSPITINRNPSGPDEFGFLQVKDGGSLNLRASSADTGHVTNHGEIGVRTDGALVALGPVVIQGGSEGLIDIGSGGLLLIGNQGTPLAATDSLTTNNEVLLDNFSTLQLTLDPTARKIGQLRTGSTLTLTALNELQLSLVNDTALTDGTKFTLVDYGKLDGDPVPGFAYFKGYPNGSTFVLGLNHYRINYKDTPDPGYTGAITLTVVPAVPPASLSPAVQTVTGTVGAPLTQTAAMIPSGFGGTVTYTISPGLPNGLTFNNATGAIFGTPTAALTTTAFTIRAAGSVSGTGTATVNLTIGVASQTISFGPAPTPTFASGGGFQVFASATSGLPVTYSSLTPAICDAHGSNILMLGAGTCTIAADQPGNSNYTAASQATQSITIAKAQPQPLTLSASSASITVGGTSTLNAAGGIPGGSVTYNVTGACSAVGSLVTGGPGTGTCTATATQASDANYLAVTSNPVAISVGVASQAALSLTASPTTITVNGVSTLTANGGTGGGSVTYTLNSGPCTLAGNVLTGTGVGQCQVTATKAESTGYSAATSSPVIVTINRLAPPALVLSASPVSVGFNGSSTLSTTGGIPGAPVNYSVSGPCSVDGNTLLGIRAGLCIVTASQAETAAYSAATSSPVTITVKERTTTFSYPQASAKIGQPFSLAPVTSGFTQPTFALLYGNLPAGLTLDPATGIISGTPTGPIGTIDDVVSVYENNAYDAALAVITIANPAPPPNPIPTLGEWGAIIMTMVMLLIGGHRRLFGR